MFNGVSDTPSCHTRLHRTAVVQRQELQVPQLRKRITAKEISDRGDPSGKVERVQAAQQHHRLVLRWRVGRIFGAEALDQRGGVARATLR